MAAVVYRCMYELPRGCNVYTGLANGSRAVAYPDAGSLAPLKAGVMLNGFNRIDCVYLLERQQLMVFIEFSY